MLRRVRLRDLTLYLCIIMYLCIIYQELGLGKFQSCIVIYLNN